MPHPLRTLLACWLACWLAVAATGTVVSHRHEGAPGHAHGWGWLRVSPSSAPAGPLLSHRHIVLLGIESGAIPDAPDSDRSDASAQVTPAFDASSPGEGGPGDPSDSPTVLAPLVARLDAPANIPFAGSAPALTRSLPPGDHTRSAVLRL